MGNDRKEQYHRPAVARPSIETSPMASQSLVGAPLACHRLNCHGAISLASPRRVAQRSGVHYRSLFWGALIVRRKSVKRGGCIFYTTTLRSGKRNARVSAQWSTVPRRPTLAVPFSQRSNEPPSGGSAGTLGFSGTALLGPFGATECVGRLRASGRSLLGRLAVDPGEDETG